MVRSFVPKALTLAACVVLLAAACSSSEPQSVATADPDTTVSDGAVSEATSPDAADSDLAVPELVGTFDTIDGGQIELGELQGQDVVLWFWAPW